MLGIAKVKNFFKSRALLYRTLFTLLLIVIFRIAATITIPGVKLNNSGQVDMGSVSSFLGLLNLLGGGGIAKFSIVALGISPYITASIIIQLLSTDAFPPLARLAKGGTAGRRKLNIITRWITLGLAIPQAVALAATLVNDQTGTFSFSGVLGDGIFMKYSFVILIMVAGSFFTLFLGEQITDKGIGNGTSLIIFSGIAVRLPNQFQIAYNWFVSSGSEVSLYGVINFVGYILLFLTLLAFIAFTYVAERRIPIQQTGRGLNLDQEKLAYLPMKFNSAGVIPVIFASSILLIPLTIAQILPVHYESREWILANLTFTAPIGLSIYLVLIALFTVFFGYVQYNPDRIGENFQKNGTFIPGIKPGDETIEYIGGVLIRTTIYAAIYLTFVSSLNFIEEISGWPNQATFGGTSTIILVTVAIETINQFKGRKTTSRLAKIKKTTTQSTGDLLW